MRILILGGGGTLGAFSAGALCALEESGWKADACIASSAGGINLLRSMVGGPREAEKFWSSLDWKWIVGDLFRHNPISGGVLDPKHFRARVEEGVDWQAVMDDPRQLGFLVVDLHTGRVSVRGNRTETSVEALRTVAHASYALPPLLAPMPLGSCLLADGGLLRNAPLEFALDMGATEIVYLCNVQVAPHNTWKNARIPAAMGRYLDIYFRRASNIGFADAPIVEGRFHGVPFLAIAPPQRLDFRDMVGSMIPTLGRMQRLIELGESSAREALQSAYRVGTAERTSLLDHEIGPASVGVRRVYPEPSANPSHMKPSSADGRGRAA
jgi:predicted acylesterase/phospholipase RssA